VAAAWVMHFEECTDHYPPPDGLVVDEHGVDSEKDTKKSLKKTDAQHEHRVRWRVVIDCNVRVREME